MMNFVSSLTGPQTVFVTLEERPVALLEALQERVLSVPVPASAPAWYRQVLADVAQFVEDAPEGEYALLASRLPGQKLPKGAVVLGVVDAESEWRSLGVDVAQVAPGMPVRSVDPSRLVIRARLGEVASQKLLAEATSDVEALFAGHPEDRPKHLAVACLGKFRNTFSSELLGLADTIEVEVDGAGVAVVKSRSAARQGTGIFA